MIRIVDSEVNSVTGERFRRVEQDGHLICWTSEEVINLARKGDLSIPSFGTYSKELVITESSE